MRRYGPSDTPSGLGGAWVCIAHPIRRYGKTRMATGFVSVLRCIATAHHNPLVGRERTSALRRPWGCSYYLLI